MGGRGTYEGKKVAGGRGVGEHAFKGIEKGATPTVKGGHSPKRGVDMANDERGRKQEI